MTIIQQLPEVSYPLTHLDKTKEIVEVLNDNLGLYYSTTNPSLTPSQGIATWVVTHNLNTENVNVDVYNNDNLVVCNVSTTSNNTVSVELLASETIAAETYKVVVVANGAASSPSGGGGGSYTLPVATTTTLGGVKIDGTSITIDDGVISSAGGTVDSTLSSTSTNPVQNQVLYPSLSNFLPDGTVINVKTDGTGDFTDVRDAVNYLNGKWSNGSVKIKLGSGTFNLSNVISIEGTNFNIPVIELDGNGVNSTTLVPPTAQWESAINVYDCYVRITNLTVTFPSASNDQFGITANARAQIYTNSCKVSNLYRGLWASNTGKLEIGSGTAIENAVQAIAAMASGTISCSYSSMSLTNCDTGFKVQSGGFITLLSPSITFSNVTNRTSQTTGNFTSEGVIIGV